VSALVRVDQIGYLPTESKYGMVAGGSPTGAFDIRRVSDGVSVYSGTLATAFTDADSGDSIRTATFSALTSTGAYYLDVAGVGFSYNFNIDPSAFANAYVYAARAFYGQRCGTAVNLGNVDGVTYAHAACHTSGTCSDNPATYHSSSGKSGTKNTVKGWHDAGDYGKYVVNSGISTGELLWTWEWWSDRLAGVSSNIPESGNGVPDVLNEARWNLEWLLTMQDTDGGVWHKNTSAGFGSFVLPNLDDSGTRYIIGSGASPYKTTCSTADFAAVMAIAARLYQPYDVTFSATCLTAAQSAYTWAVANPTQYFNNPSGISTGGYGDNNATDELLWAAAELFRTTGTATYNTYVTSNTPGSTLFGTGLQQDWANVRNLALWTYYFSGQASANAALRTRIFTDTTTAATTIANRTNGASNGYKVSLNGTGEYIWGSNGAVANYAIMLLVADRMSPSSNYTNAALNDLHYILGRNTFDTSYVTHLGSNPFLHPHHRPSGSSAYSGGAPWPGLMNGGPNYTGSTSGDGTTPANSYPAKCWIDAQAAYASNEIAINWQAPLVFLLAYTLPTPVAGTPTFTPTNTPSATPTATRTASPTPTQTRTASPSPTPTASSTLTATPSASPTASPTRTASPSATPSVSLTATLTASPTATPSATRSATRTASPTPSATPSSTASPTGTLSGTVTSTSTATPVFTYTQTPSITLTGTPSGTLTQTPSVTATPTTTDSPSVTATATETPVYTFTHTPSITLTGTPSPTSSASPTLTATPTASVTASITLTASPTATPTASPTPTPVYTGTLTPSSTPTRTPGPAAAGGPLKVLGAAFFPHPVVGPLLQLRFLLDNPADRVKLKVYSRAMVVSVVLEANGSYSPGWNSATFAAPELAAGTWFATVTAYQGGVASEKAAPLRLVKIK
jgi:endoglucanase